MEGNFFNKEKYSINEDKEEAPICSEIRLPKDIEILFAEGKSKIKEFMNKKLNRRIQLIKKEIELEEKKRIECLKSQLESSILKSNLGIKINRAELLMNKRNNVIPLIEEKEEEDDDDDYEGYAF